MAPDFGDLNLINDSAYVFSKKIESYWATSCSKWRFYKPSSKTPHQFLLITNFKEGRELLVLANEALTNHTECYQNEFKCKRWSIQMYINRTKESYVQNVQKNDNNVVDEDLDNI